MRRGLSSRIKPASHQSKLGAYMRRRKVASRALFAFIALILTVTSSYTIFSQLSRTSLAADPLTVTSISPDQGPDSGGTQVVIDGSGFMKELTFKQIAAGGGHTCAIGSDNGLYCWGDYSNDQSGSVSTMPVAVPMGEVPTGVTPISISAGGSQTCILGSDSRAYCWGDFYGGAPVAVPQGAIPAGVTLTSVSPGDGHTCAIGSDNQAYCWGLNYSGELGDGTTTISFDPVAVSRGAIPSGVTFASISASSSGTCAIGSDGNAYCWGSNNGGRLGNDTTNSSVPVAISQGAIPGGVALKSISTGPTHVCVLGSNDQAYCWGTNYAGELGNGTTASSLSPVAVSQGSIPAGVSLVNVSTGSFRTCALGTDGKTYCWGDAANGSVPVAISQGAIPAGVTLTQVSTGDRFACALGSNQETYCWGSDDTAQLGNGTRYQDSPDPVLVSDMSLVRSVTFDEQNAMNVKPLSTTKLSVTTPQHTVGPVPVVVTDINGNSVTFNSYTYVDGTPPVITMTSGWNGYEATIDPGDSFDLRAQIQSVADNIDGELDVNDVKIASVPEFNQNVPGTYTITYSIADSAGNVGTAQGTIVVKGIGYQDVVTNNPAPTLTGTQGGYTYGIGLRTYIVPSGTTFDPANPGDMKERYYMQRSSGSSDWQIVTDQSKLKDAVTDYVLRDAAVGLKNYLVPEATFSDPPTMDELLDYCSDQRVQQNYGASDEATCRSAAQDNLTYSIDSRYAAALNSNIYDYTPFADGAYDIYFVQDTTTVASFPRGLIVDTAAPSVTVTPPSGTATSPEISGTVSGPKAKITVRINGKTYLARNNGNGTWTLAAGTIENLAPGTYDVLVTATDEAGNEATAQTTLTIQQGATTPDGSTPTNPISAISAAAGRLAETGVSIWLIVGGALAAIAAAGAMLLALRKRRA